MFLKGDFVINSLSHPVFKVGDRVRVDLEVDVLRIMQEGHGGWNPRMEEVCYYYNENNSYQRIQLLFI